jgi:hypothetical protein
MGTEKERRKVVMDARGWCDGPSNITSCLRG